MTIAGRSDFEGMQRVGRVVAETLAFLTAEVTPGMTTAELDERGARFLRARGARPAPQFTYGFPGSILISVNEEIVHGVPGPRFLAPGDLVKIDVTAELDGFVADAARTVALPGASPAARQLARCARQAFGAAMVAAVPGNPVRWLGRAIERAVKKAVFAVLRDLTGHGVGRTIHEAPTVPNFDDPTERAILRDGLVLAVEPLVSVRPAQVVEAADGWTLKTHNGAWAAHYENTIVVRRGRPVVLTALAPQPG